MATQPLVLLSFYKTLLSNVFTNFSTALRLAARWPWHLQGRIAKSQGLLPWHDFTIVPPLRLLLITSRLISNNL